MSRFEKSRPCRVRRWIATHLILIGLVLIVGIACAEDASNASPWMHWSSLRMKAKSVPLFSGNIEFELTGTKSERRLETRATAKFIGATIARSRTVTTFDAETGLPREYTQLSKKRGRRYRFGENGYTVEKLKPGKDSTETPNTWEVTSHSKFDSPRDETGKKQPLFDYYGMLIYLRNLELDGPGEEVTIFVATSKGPQPYRVVVVETRSRTLRYRDLADDTKKSVASREFRLRIIPADPDAADEGFMNMEGETELWVEAESKTPIEISGNVPKVPGRVRLVLTGMGR